MNLKKCDNGHFYDTDKYPVCPHCNQNAGDGKTMGMMPPKQEMSPGLENKPMNFQDILNQAQPQANTKHSVLSDDNVTVGIYTKSSKGTEPVVGWLVCVAGELWGECFKLKSGKNFIGRGNDMDVVLSKDMSVSRNKHAVIIYEPRSRVFYAQPGESHELFYLNDKVVLNNEELKPNDVLMIGETRVIFIPLCSKEFSWDDYKKE